MSGTVLSPVESTLPRRRWTVAEYQQAARAGVFGPEERLELIRGEIVEHMPPDPPHSGTTGLVSRALQEAFAGIDCHVRTENPVVLPQDGQPQPDAAVVHGDPRRYMTRHPEPGDILLLVEVANSSLADDRWIKGPLFAEAGVAEYWIVNLKDRQLEVHRAPQNGVWTSTFVVRASGSVSPLAAPAAVVAVADLLP